VKPDTIKFGIKLKKVLKEGKHFKSSRTAFATACRRANLSDVVRQTLRHMFASRLGIGGAGDRVRYALGC